MPLRHRHGSLLNGPVRCEKNAERVPVLAAPPRRFGPNLRTPAALDVRIGAAEVESRRVAAAPHRSSHDLERILATDLNHALLVPYRSVAGFEIRHQTEVAVRRGVVEPMRETVAEVAQQERREGGSGTYHQCPGAQATRPSRRLVVDRILHSSPCVRRCEIIEWANPKPRCRRRTPLSRSGCLSRSR